MTCEKACSKCGVVKQPDEFYSDSRHPDRTWGACKECTREYTRKYYAANRERKLAREKARHAANKATVNANRRDWYAEHRVQEYAKSAVKNALKYGRLQRGPCASCGSTARVHGHHDDYSKPLDVTWLCSGCHKRLHASLSKGE